MNTTYFDEMTANCAAYERAKKEYTECKQQIAETYGWDSLEMYAWNEAGNTKPTYPYSNGAMMAYNVFKNRSDNLEDECEMDETIWNEEFSDFVTTLRKLGVTEFTITKDISGMIGTLYQFTDEGCTVAGLHTIVKLRNSWGWKKRKGILIKVN